MTQELADSTADEHASMSGRREVGPTLRWRASPVELALESSRRMRHGELPGPFCAEVGRRMLLAQSDFGEWVLRRVESVAFQEDRSVLRQITVDLRVRDDAPVFVDERDREYWLVPIAVMWRRTLVDFHMSDEQEKPLTLPGLRLTQQLDQAILLAAAATASVLPGAAEAADDEVGGFVQRLVAGRRQEVFDTWEQFERLGPEDDGVLAALRKSEVFYPTARRMRSSFTLYVFLAVEDGRHRLLRMSFVEPIRWGYQVPTLTSRDGAHGSLEYRTGQPVLHGRRRERLLATLGLSPTRIRFQVPSAERAASYHFELVAPQGVRVDKATLLAGRPHEPDRAPTEDHVETGTLTVGLHGVEVPPGSLCRVQVDVRVQSAGWLAVMVMSGLATAVVLLSVVLHLFTQKGQGPEQYNNVVVLLVTTAAAAATFVAHREFGGVAARLVVGVRMVAAVCIALPVIAAGFIAYTEQQPTDAPEPRTAAAVLLLCALAFALTAHLGAVWWLSWRVERRGRIPSPWDMTGYEQFREDRRFDRATVVEEAPSTSFDAALRRHGFHRPTVGLPSSEAWHEVYDLTDARHEATVRALSGMVEPQEGRVPFQCADPTSCPRKDACLVLPPAAGGPRA
jgi:hypothetical protein